MAIGERFGNRVFFPGDDGAFDLEGLEEFTHLEVEGGELGAAGTVTTPQSTTLSATPAPQHAQASRSYPGFSSVVNTPTHSARRGHVFNLKVIQARIDDFPLSGRPTFVRLGQTFIELCEATANVPFISDQVQREFGDNHVLVSVEGLEFSDSSGTRGDSSRALTRQLCVFVDIITMYFCDVHYPKFLFSVTYCVGMKFWKTNSRKVYAVSEEDLHVRQQPRRRRRPEDVNEGDFESTVKLMKADLTSIRENINKLCTATKDTVIPIGLKVTLQDTLKCKICLSAPMQHPVIYAKCCKTLIGCESCVNHWYAGEGINKACPVCGTDRGLTETSRVCGLEELLDGVREALSSNV